MENVHELLPFYALDMLTPEEKMAVEAYLKNNPSVRDELAELYAASERLIQTVEPLTPSPQVKVNLMARVAESLNSTPAAAPTVKEEAISWWQRGFFQRAAPVLGVAFAAVAFIWAFTLLGSLNDTRAQLAALESTTTALQAELVTMGDMQAELIAAQATASALEAEVAELRLQNQTLAQELEQEVALMRTLTSLNSEQVMFGSADSPRGLLTVNRSAETAFLSITGLDTLSESQTYQFWLIGDAGAASGGIFSVDEMGDGKLLIQTDALQSFSTLGISIEPSGGSDAPTEVIFVEEL